MRKPDFITASQARYLIAWPKYLTNGFLCFVIQNAKTIRMYTRLEKKHQKKLNEYKESDTGSKRFIETIDEMVARYSTDLPIFNIEGEESEKYGKLELRDNTRQLLADTYGPLTYQIAGLVVFAMQNGKTMAIAMAQRV